MLEAVLNVSATSRSALLESPLASTSSPASISVSLRSSLFEDDELAATPLRRAGNVSGLAAGDRAQDLLLEELEAVRYEKRLLEVNFKRMEQSAAQRLRETTRRYEAQVRTLKERVQSAERGLPELRRRLDASRADFAGGIQCSASQYEQLQKLSEDELTVRELVLVKVFELTASLRAQLAEATTQQERAIAAKTALEARTESAEARLESERARLQARARELESDLARAQDEATQFKDKHLEALRQLDKVREDSERTGALRARISDLERELAQARQVGNGAVAHGEATQQTLALKASELEHALRDLELVKQDKNYLAREADARKLEAARLTSELGREQDRVQSLQVRLDEAREHLHEGLQQARSEYEERLSREVDAMRNEHNKQIAQLKEVQLETAEREARAMRAAREEAIVDAGHLRAQLSDAQTALDEARVELATKDASNEAALARARGELNRRVFEIETLSATVDAKMAALRKLEIENEMLRSKFDILRDDFAALESSTAKTIVERTARIATLEEKVHAYEALELELDAAVVEQAKLRAEAVEEPREETAAPAAGDAKLAFDAQSENTKGMVANASAAASRFSAQLPIAAQRRVQQSVLLAEKLVRTERELEASKRHARELEAALRSTQAEAHAAADVAASATQPQAYLLEKLKDRDNALERAHREARELQTSLQALRAELAKVEATRDGLHADLQRVLSDRRILERAIPRLQGAGGGRGAASSRGHFSPTLASLTATQGRGNPKSASRRSPQSAPLPGMAKHARGRETDPFRGLLVHVNDDDDDDDDDVDDDGKQKGQEGNDQEYEKDGGDGDDDDDEEEDDDVDAFVVDAGASALSGQGMLFHDNNNDDDTIQEVDMPDALGRSTLSVGSVESSTFVLHREDDQGIPLPKWYRKLRQEP
ncbi:Hypothetical Protein FCC1311_054432 [Hondaea fermentalgiana]|uniref:Uncharacterized protein n=1 Tax=Hondaea fermentalgiana TaxID=2315210 RepID=A0A2R5GLQ9_9STRA|nr:Hypothetical Protein FCC1311_054432 [Hondaea fermentalgiana]|eukprot:GBG29221.1 Hypothetical Protein FCC1311_054432 [Hondaea fermentalgiana]